MEIDLAKIRLLNSTNLPATSIGLSCFDARGSHAAFTFSRLLSSSTQVKYLVNQNSILFGTTTEQFKIEREAAVDINNTVYRHCVELMGYFYPNEDLRFSGPTTVVDNILDVLNENLIFYGQEETNRFSVTSIDTCIDLGDPGCVYSGLIEIAPIAEEGRSKIAPVEKHSIAGAAIVCLSDGRLVGVTVAAADDRFYIVPAKRLLEEFGMTIVKPTPNLLEELRAIGGGIETDASLQITDDELNEIKVFVASYSKAHGWPEQKTSETRPDLVQHIDEKSQSTHPPLQK